MSTPTQPETLTLEKLNSLEFWLGNSPTEDALGCVPVDKGELLGLISMARSALHHLEAGRKPCECRSMQIAIAAGSLPLRNGIPSVAECYIQFCPWCGGTIPTSSTGEEKA